MEDKEHSKIDEQVAQPETQSALNTEGSSRRKFIRNVAAGVTGAALAHFALLGGTQKADALSECGGMVYDACCVNPDSDDVCNLLDPDQCGPNGGAGDVCNFVISPDSCPAGGGPSVDACDASSPDVV